LKKRRNPDKDLTDGNPENQGEDGDSCDEVCDDLDEFDDFESDDSSSVLIDEDSYQEKQVKYSHNNSWTWTTKFEELGDEEFKLILPFLELKDLKNLKLANKRFEYRVTQFDARVQKWHIRVFLFSKYDKTLNKSKKKKLFQFVTLKFKIEEDIEAKEKKKILLDYKDKIVDLDLVMDGCDRFLSDFPLPKLTKLTADIGQYGASGEIEDESEAESSECDEEVSEDDEQSKSVKKVSSDAKSKKIETTESGDVGGLKAIIFKKCAPFLSEILNSRNIGKTVTSVTIIPESNPDFKIDITFTEVEQLFMKNYGNCRWMILPELQSLVVLGECNLVMDRIPMLPNLKVLMVDDLTVNLANKCLDSLEFLIIVCDDPFDKDVLVLKDLMFPKLKHLVFGGNCLPMEKFILNHKNTLETVAMINMLTDDHDSFESFDSGLSRSQKDLELHNEDFIKTLVKDFPSLRRLVLPANRERVRDKCGRVKIMYEEKEVLTSLKFICRSHYKLLDDQFCDIIYETP